MGVEPCFVLFPIVIAELVGHFVLAPLMGGQDLRWWPRRFSIGDFVLLALYLQLVVAVFAAVAPEKGQRELWTIGLFVVAFATAALWSFAMSVAEQLEMRPRKKHWLTLVLLPLTGVAMIAPAAAIVFWMFLLGEGFGPRGLSVLEVTGGVAAIFTIYPGPLLLRRFANWIVKKETLNPVSGDASPG